MALTRTQFDILEPLTAETLTRRQLQERTGLSPDAVERTLRELTEAGLLRDGQITDAGRAAMEPYRVKRAVFLAAGFGVRLAPVTFHTPKPLVRVHGKRIIDGLIDACLDIGIEELWVVRGYLAGQFEALPEKYPMIRFLENPLYGEANNISSALAARHLLCNAYVLESDLLLFNPRILKPYHYASDFLAFPTARTDDWCFAAADGVITEQRLGGEGDNIWQMVGISYWNGADGLALSRDIADVYAMPGGRELFWEQVPLAVRREHYRVELRPCAAGDTAEIDTFRELKAIDSTYDV